MGSIAKSVVRESLRARPGEAVVITTSPRTEGLATEVAVECYRAGAEPLMLLESDDFFYGQFKHLSEDQLRTPSPHCLGIADYANSYIWMGGVEDPAGMRRVPQAKWGAMFQGEEAHRRKSLEKKHKSVGVGLGLVTRPRAKAYGFDFNAWKRMVEQGIAVDYAVMRRTGEALGRRLGGPAVVEVTADNGTNLSFRLVGPGRKAHVDDGVISDEDIAAGNVNANLPAGAVAVAPVEGSATGTFVSDVKVPQVGTLIEGLAWTFKNGRLMDFAAKRNLKSAQLNYAEAMGPKDMFASLTLGINPMLKPGFLTSAYARGVVTVGIGDNQDLGGANDTAYGFAASLSKATVAIDGRTVVEDGRLVT